MQFYTLLITAAVVSAAADGNAEKMTANPIRKVVTLLEGMLTKVEAEGKQEKKLFETFMCTCKKGMADLDKTIASNSAKIPGLQSQITQSTSSQAKLKDDLVNHRTSLAGAGEALASATSVRAKEEKAFTADSGERNGFIASIKQALPALEKGMTGSSLLQSESAAALNVRKAATADAALTDDDRDAVVSFLTVGANDKSEGSGEIVGILKTMMENYQKDVAALTSTETAAANGFEELQEAKTSEMKSLRTTIQKKTQRAGEAAVDLVQKKGDLKQTAEMVAADQEMLKNLNAECTDKPVEQEERTKMRNDEVAAIHDTVKLLSNDDALDVFKATLPSAAGAFLQLASGSMKTIQKRLNDAHLAADILKKDPTTKSRPELHFLELALMGKKVDFGKVTKLIDDMIALTNKENVDDIAKKKYCKVELHKTEVKGQAIGRNIKEQSANQDDRTEKLTALVEEIKNMQSEIVALDQLTKDTEKERKSQNAEYSETMSGKTAAKEILNFAKTRLNKFYNPGSHATEKSLSFAAQPHYAPKAAEVDEDSKLEWHEANPVISKDLLKVLDKREPATQGTMLISTEISTTDLTELYRYRDSRKVTDMMNQLINEVTNEMAVAKHEEETTQKQYETVVSDSAKKRATYVKSLNGAQNAKADNEQSKTLEDEALAGSKAERLANKATMKQFHDECDWMMANFDLRASARSEEADSLKKAKAVLHGADYGALLLQEEAFHAQHRSQVLHLTQKRKELKSKADALLFQLHSAKALRGFRAKHA